MREQNQGFLFAWEYKPRQSVESIETSEERAIEKLDLWIDKHLWLWLIWDLPGFRWIWYQLKPNAEKEKHQMKPAATLTIWVIGIYTALFGMASQRYEFTADRIELRANALVTLLANDESRLGATPQVAEVQGMQCPVNPDFLNPSSVFSSFLGDQSTYKPASDLLVKTLEGFSRQLGKKEETKQFALLHLANLSGAFMYGADLSGAYLSETNLSGAFLLGANLSKADLSEANLSKAELSETNLSRALLLRAELSEADLSGADLSEADLSGADLAWANLSGADLSGADLSEANLSRADLSGADLSWVTLSWADLSGVDLSGADLSLADLSRADLRNICYWNDVKSLKNTNIANIKNPPEGFREWALEQGAAEMEVDEWKAFKESILASLK